MATPAPAIERSGLLLALGAAALFSTAPILTRWVGNGLGPYEISFWRSAVGAAVVLAAARLLRPRLPADRPTTSRALEGTSPASAGANLRTYTVTGLFAALHFVFYIASIQYTTIAHALAIVYTAPVWTALAAHAGGERLAPHRWLGIGVAVVGVALLVGVGSDSGATLRGDLMALASALAFSAYSLAGRRARGGADLLTYAGAVYLVAALWTLPAAALTWSSGGYTPQAMVGLLLLGLLPLALGHTLFNAALRRAPAAVVNVLATQELTFGIALGVLLLDEVPSVGSLLGVLVTVIGAILVIV